MISLPKSQRTHSFSFLQVCMALDVNAVVIALSRRALDSRKEGNAPPYGLGLYSCCDSPCLSSVRSWPSFTIGPATVGGLERESRSYTCRQNSALLFKVVTPPSVLYDRGRQCLHLRSSQALQMNQHISFSGHNYINNLLHSSRCRLARLFQRKITYFSIPYPPSFGGIPSSALGTSFSAAWEGPSRVEEQRRALVHFRRPLPPQSSTAHPGQDREGRQPIVSLSRWVSSV